MDEGIFTEDIKGFHLPFQNLIEHLHIGQARFFWNPSLPYFLELPARLFVFHFLIAGKELGKTSHIESTLGIILSEQWIDAPSPFFCLSSQQGQVAEGFYYLCSISMLYYTRAKDDRPLFCREIEIGDSL